MAENWRRIPWYTEKCPRHFHSTQHERKTSFLFSAIVFISSSVFNLYRVQCLICNWLFYVVTLVGYSDPWVILFLKLLSYGHLSNEWYRSHVLHGHFWLVKVVTPFSSIDKMKAEKSKKKKGTESAISQKFYDSVIVIAT